LKKSIKDSQGLNEATEEDNVVRKLNLENFEKKKINRTAWTSEEFRRRNNELIDKYEINSNSNVNLKNGNHFDIILNKENENVFNINSKTFNELRDTIENHLEVNNPNLILAKRNTVEKNEIIVDNLNNQDDNQENYNININGPTLDKGDVLEQENESNFDKGILLNLEHKFNGSKKSKISNMIDADNRNNNGNQSNCNINFNIPTFLMEKLEKEGIISYDSSPVEKKLEQENPNSTETLDANQKHAINPSDSKLNDREDSNLIQKDYNINFQNSKENYENKQEFTNNPMQANNITNEKSTNNSTRNITKKIEKKNSLFRGDMFILDPNGVSNESKKVSIYCIKTIFYKIITKIYS